MNKTLIGILVLTTSVIASAQAPLKNRVYELDTIVMCDDNYEARCERQVRMAGLLSTDKVIIRASCSKPYTRGVNSYEGCVDYHSKIIILEE